MKFYVHKLGCPKNDVDADYLAASLIEDGHEPVQSVGEAEAIVVNTCAFILPAREESIGEILRLSRLKTDGQARCLYATGCLSQRYGDELLAEIPELDGAFGLGMLDSLARAFKRTGRSEKSVRQDSRDLDYVSWHRRYIADSYPYAYLKISDGCDRRCTYCAIPQIRGRFRSRPVEAIVREARYLADRGKRELILVSQDATLYGYDLKGRPAIEDLLAELDTIDGVRWIRLMYLYPPKLETRVIEYLADDNKTLNYFDLPLQHVNEDLLAAMGRRTDPGTTEALIRSIRAVSPDATIRTTFIVGFPGETPGHFEQLRDFVADSRFDRMGVFMYSREEDTPAAASSQQVPEDVKAARMDDLMNLQREIAFARNESLIGSVQQVIIDSVEDDRRAVGRSRGDCPEIDQEVRVDGHGFRCGDIVNVRIDATDGYDLQGTYVEA